MSNRQRPASVATAYHEAGHAIAALELGLKLDSATIIPDGTTAGRVSHVCPLRGIRPDMDGSNRARLRAEKAIMVYLAGPAAQRGTALPAIATFTRSRIYRMLSISPCTSPAVSVRQDSISAGLKNGPGFWWRARSTGSGSKP